MSYPILYESTETAFLSNGFGVLSDATYCMVTEERNGGFELVMKYPVSGIHFEALALRRILYAKPNTYSGMQAFRIYEISKPLKGIVTVRSEHISYDLNGIVVSPFTAVGAEAALSGLKANAVCDCPFTFWTDIENAGAFSVDMPSSIRQKLGGESGSVLTIAYGEYEFDNFAVKLHQHRGENRGASIRYGKNLTDLVQEENCANVYTGVYPFWKGVDGEIVQLPEKIIPVPGNFDFTRIKIRDYSLIFENKPTEEQLREKATEYAETSGIGKPKVSLDISFVQLEKSEEYAGKAFLERVRLCDTVNVEFPKLGVSATAKAVTYVYNVLLDRAEKIHLGDAKTSIIDTIISQEQEIVKKPNTPQIQTAVNSLTAAILGAAGGAVRMLDTDGDGMLDTLYIADDPDPMKAVRVWRFNYMGWGASENGYDGPFTMGASLEDGLVADFITAGTLKAIDLAACHMKGGTLNINDNFIVDELGNLTSYGDARIYGAKIYALANGEIGGWTAMAVDGFSIYNKYGEELVKIGYPTEENDYPYITLKSNQRESTSGLMKRFDDGLWYGNDAPKNDFGIFTAKPSYQGIFVSFSEGKTYVVSGENMKNIYTGEAIARFG